MNHRIAIVVSAVCITLLALLGALDWFVFDDNSPMQDYVRGTLTETIGILMTVLVVDRLFASHNAKQEAAAEAQSLLNAHRVLAQYIVRFHLYAYQVVTPLEKRSGQPAMTRCPERWEFSDMKDLFFSSMLVIDGRTPVVLRCLATLRDLQMHVESMLASMPLRHFPAISETLLSFTERVGSIDLYEGIKFDSEAIMGTEKMKDFVKKMLAEHQGKPEYKGSNVITKYVALYYTLIDAVSLMNRYESQVADLPIR